MQRSAPPAPGGARATAAACLLLVAGSLAGGSAAAQSLPSDAFLSQSAAERAKPGLLAAPLKALRVATLEWPYPAFEAGAQPGAAPAEDPTYSFPPALVLASAASTDTIREPAMVAPLAGDLTVEDAPAIFGPAPASDLAYAEVALDIVMSLPGLDGTATTGADTAPDLAQDIAQDPGTDTAPAYGPDLSGLDATLDGTIGEEASTAPAEGTANAPLANAPLANAALAKTAFADTAHGDPAPEPGAGAEAPLYRDPAVVFGTGGTLFPALAFEHWMLEDDSGAVPTPIAPPGRDMPATGPGAAPAERLGLEGPQRARAEKCLAEAIYFESRGEPKRGQIAVAQVIINRVFSGYYPADVCKTVYQNAQRRNACQFTFACDYVKDVIREPDMWVQAKEIASDMLDGKLWLEGVGKATHYHAYWVHPTWVREMRKLDRIGVHTFYRPRRWDG